MRFNKSPSGLIYTSAHPRFALRLHECHGHGAKKFHPHFQGVFVCVLVLNIRAFFRRI